MLRVEFDSETTTRLARHANQMRAMDSSGMVQEALKSWYELDASYLLKQGVQDVLGTDEMGYILNPDYAKKKEENPFVLRLSGKSSEEQGVLSGALYDSMQFKVDAKGATLFIGNVNVSFRAGAFMHATDTMEFMLRYHNRDSSRRYKPPTMRQKKARAAQVLDYANKLNMRSNFMEKGIRKVEPQLASSLQERLTQALLRTLGVNVGELMNEKGSVFG